MQTIDWRKVVANDPNLEHPSLSDPELAFAENYHNWPYVITKRRDSEKQFEGYAHTDQSTIVLVDLLGDGQQEAVIPVDATGNNFYGYEGVLVYGAKDSVIALIRTLPSQKAFEVRADGNQIVFREPIFQGWEGLCCPSGWSDTWYRLEDTGFIGVKHAWSLDPRLRQWAVENYYGILESTSYQDPYIRDFYEKYLSPAFRATHPFDEWHAEYQDTISIEYKTSELPDGSIAVDLLKTDKTKTGTVTQHLVAKWTLVATAGGWLLDTYQIETGP